MIQKLIFTMLLTAGTFMGAHANAVKPIPKLSMHNDPTEEELLRPITPFHLQGAVLPSWRDNWFIAVSGGTSAFIGSPLGHEDLFGRLEPTLQISVGKWHTPTLGNRLVFQGFKWKSCELKEQQYRHWHADWLWNILPTFTSNGESDRWDLIPLVGVGMIDNRTAERNTFAINYGILGRYRLTDALHITAEIGNATTFKDADGFGSSRRFGDNLLSLTAGVSWTFGSHIGWRKVVDSKPYMKQNERLSAYIWTLKQRNEELERGYNDNVRIIAELRKILDIEGLLDKYLSCFDNYAGNSANGYPVNDYSGLNSLRKRLREGEKSAFASSSKSASASTSKQGRSKSKSKHKVDANDEQSTSASSGDKRFGSENYLANLTTEGDCLGAPIFFFFELNTSKLVDSSQTVNLNEIARVVLKYGLNIEVIGAADSDTGTDEINDHLGIERADYITEYLVAHGVDASRITSHSEGGIDTYTPTNANRNAIVRLFLP
jgi:outer membrane protein OmpA-like peptidoglycan-associated protein